MDALFVLYNRLNKSKSAMNIDDLFTQALLDNDLYSKIVTQHGHRATPMQVDEYGGLP